MLFKRTAIAIASTSLLASFAYAEGENSVVNPIVVSGARYEQPLSDVLPSVTVITKEEIEKSQKQSIADILQGQQGVEIGRNGGLGTTTSFFMRGEASTNIALYVDGIRVQPDSTGSLSGISAALPPPQSIERIEILRGNSGALYGEGAIGGVINIYTSANSDNAPKAFVSSTIGSYNTLDNAAGIGGRVDDVRFNITVNETTSAGFDPIVRPASSANPGAGQYRGDGLNASISKLISKDFEIGFKDRYQDGTLNYGSNYTTGILTQRTIGNDATLYAKFKPLENWSSQVDVTNSVLAYTYNPNAIVNDYATNASTNTNVINWSNVYSFSNLHKLTFGGTYSAQTLQSDSMNANRNSYAFYAGDNLKLGRFDFQLNGRYDALSVNQPNSATTPTSNNFHAMTGLAGIGYYVTDELRLTASTSTGFRAPAIQEFFPNAGWGYIANANLMPETHSTQEYGFEYKNTNSLTRVVYFNTTTNNAISSVTVAPYTYQYQNIPTVTNQGWEFSERAEYKGYRLVGSLTIQNPVDVSTSTPLARRANQYGSVDLSKTIGKYDVGAQFISSSMRYDGSSTLGSYNLWSFYAGYKLNEEFTLRARLDNAFNTNYQLVSGYNAPGTTAMVTLIYRQK